MGLSLASSDRSSIKGNKIGTNLGGTLTISNLGDGINLSSCNDIEIGGSGVLDGNLISGNFNGIYAYYCYRGVIIKGNKIGTDINGTSALGNNGNGTQQISNNGIYLIYTENITIGGIGTNDFNIISGNSNGTGILAEFSDDLIIKGNKIGTDISGTLDLGNVNGIDLSNCNDPIIGVEGNGRNVISGNDWMGIHLINTQRGKINNNIIGTDILGTVSLYNDFAIVIENCSMTQIGGSQNVNGNLISGNISGGIFNNNSPLTVIKGNKIGTNFLGTSIIANSYGIASVDSDGLIIGRDNVGDGNLI
jgi:hypothetical protein